MVKRSLNIKNYCQIIRVTAFFIRHPRTLFNGDPVSLKPDYDWVYGP